MNPNKVGMLLIAGVFVLVASIIATLTMLEGRQGGIDLETNCPKDGRTYHSTVILVDRTDPMTPSQHRVVLDLIQGLKSNLELFEKVAIYSINSRSDVAPSPVFECCNPGSPDEANAWFENPELIRERFETEFSRPFDAAMNASITPGSQERSPVIETIQAVLTNHRLDEHISHLRLVLISDMFQNTSSYSHYRDGYSYARFLRIAGSALAESNLAGVQVTLYYLWRPGLSAADAARHLTFWDEYFRANGSSLQEVRRIR